MNRATMPDRVLPGRPFRRKAFPAGPGQRVDQTEAAVQHVDPLVGHLLAGYICTGRLSTSLVAMAAFATRFDDLRLSQSSAPGMRSTVYEEWFSTELAECWDSNSDDAASPSWVRSVAWQTRGPSRTSSTAQSAQRFVRLQTRPIG
jgi:hypothetical protein